jgi:gamma-glutamylcyclotransferase (GGCT)/AIG2-like uncharacterized protein YtfP
LARANSDFLRANIPISGKFTEGWENMTDDPLLFVYGTLRRAFDGPMALWLRGVATHLGPATARGSLYRVEDYPAFVPNGPGRVTGDLFALPDPVAILAALDVYEECSDDFPMPHEYRRERLTVLTLKGTLEAWTYIYARDVAVLPRIESGDFLL